MYNGKYWQEYVKEMLKKNAECKTNLSFDNICHKSLVIIEVLGER